MSILNNGRVVFFSFLIMRYISRIMKNQDTQTIFMHGFEVQVIFKRNKKMYLRVLPPDGRVVVTAPLHTPKQTISSFIKQKSSWITQQQHALTHNSLHAVAVNQELLHKASENIQQLLPDLLNKWGEIIGKRPSHITLRYMKTRWGSCTPATARIRLNAILGALPPQYLEYVLVHEITHLWVKGHGADFKQHMDSYLPQWRTLRRELNAYTIQ